MGIVRTNQWLEEEFDRPTKICEKLLPYFKGYTANEIYHQLISFGMYKPSRSSKYIFDIMIKEKMWNQVEKLFQHYQKKWSGPDIPIFLFPIAQSGGFFFRVEKNKSGVSYPDKMFLFLSPLDDSKELEALFVHEYHHVCRLSKLNKKMNQYTLLDSIIIEGLAEYAVLKNCGRNYTASWCHMYTEQEIKGFWKKYLNDQLDRKKNERTHDQLLYGGGRIPKLLGYAAGYQIVKEYYEGHHYSTKQSFTIPSSKFIE
ncbi:DUF2268 domain-containing protein [Bacillus sp. UNC438CL73TsuS30]|uniref:DUF2268 domain-containing protein n=1 Tax=Bacillus sp. UNC438CL73TsuS30 TaxID=1340434 RepID=UPI000479ABF4|nr:DUF2268 domain-containing protein [Bacillus sp. UNC438CL73TsuS30]